MSELLSQVAESTVGAATETNESVQGSINIPECFGDLREMDNEKVTARKANEIGHWQYRFLTVWRTVS